MDIHTRQLLFHYVSLVCLIFFFQQLSLSIHEGHNTIENCGSSLSQIQLERHFLGPGVTRVEVEDGRVRGVLFVPPGPGPHPAIIDMFGGAAVMTEMRSGKYHNHY